MVVESTAISEQTGVVSVLSFNQVSKDLFLNDDAHKQFKNWLDSFGLKWKSSIVVLHPTSFWPKEFSHIGLLFFRICICHLPVLSFLYDIISVEALVTLEQYRAARKQEKINSAWGEKSLCSVCTLVCLSSGHQKLGYENFSRIQKRSVVKKDESFIHQELTNDMRVSRKVTTLFLFGGRKNGRIHLPLNFQYLCSLFPAKSRQSNGWAALWSFYWQHFHTVQAFFISSSVLNLDIFDFEEFFDFEEHVGRRAQDRC